ncbi:hypothetical protein [Actinoalloteichus hymeniacidonis]|uniref:DUF2273 domain-containing protein n=1 Tax=Actinoalloteichus hymeniacidonis TaxID=340345 RepID=A0AAC9HTK8_9PSEU|nr:hypothetical protein [Actinoalloteichus hymeniacidonis]AOS64886.1 hypothetical protein TL08_20475 [Actinoalloteichus hymeniacidonis]MBB5907039.1 hypothetical protein [Actinoalloteichus hymeniacidonis]
MTTTQAGLITGLALGLAGSLGGFSAFVICLVVGVIGLGVGRALEGELDLTGLLGRDRGADR